MKSLLALWNVSDAHGRALPQHLLPPPTLATLGGPKPSREPCWEGGGGWRKGPEDLKSLN